MALSFQMLEKFNYDFLLLDRRKAIERSYAKFSPCYSIFREDSKVEWFRLLDLKSGGPWFKSSTLLLQISLKALGWTQDYCENKSR